MGKYYLSRVISLALMLVMSMVSLQAQDDYADKYFPKIRERLNEGNCERAQDLYNVYKQMTNRTNLDIEQGIAECKSGKSGSKDRSQAGGTSAKGSNQSFTVGGVQFTMVWVEGGTFTMGCTSEQGGECDSSETPAHSVTLSSYYMGETEVTQALWQAVMGNNPSYFKGDNLPVDNVSWDDAQEFIQKLNQLTGRTFRLPTEAEWEYAARGGKSTSLYNGENITIKGINNSPNLDRLAWYGGNCGQDYTRSAGCDEANGVDISGWPEKQYRDSRGGTHPVGAKQPNAFGLYDMLGNVYEWCSDWYGDYSSSLQRDPGGPSTGSSRVGRGGCWRSDAQYCRVFHRNVISPSFRIDHFGFRLVLVP